MGEQTKIEWCDATFNPWIGCTKLSEGCRNCYALDLMETRYKRVKWGPTGTRQRTSEANWRKPLQWSKEKWCQCSVCGWRGSLKEVAWSVPRGFVCPVCQGKAEPTRARVFCASLADVFEDRPELAPWRADLFDLIAQTPNLDWLLLTKRPENVNDMVPAQWRNVNRWPANVWMGTSVEDQQRADERIPHLLKVPARVRFLSMEPLLGPVDLRSLWLPKTCWHCNEELHGLPGRCWCGVCHYPDIRWIIVGGESGHNARPMHPEWARSLRDQCQVAGVAFHFKQFGEWRPAQEGERGIFFNYDGTPVAGPFAPYSSSQVYLAKVGKHAAGRLLDGRTWDEFPRP